MGLKLIKKFRWFAFAVSMSAFLFCADQVNAQTIQQEDMHVLRARSETDKFKSELKLSDKQYQQAYDINLKYAKDQNNIRNLGKSRKATNKALKASEKKKTQELKMVLDENQFKEYNKGVKAEEERNQIAEDAIVAKEKAAKADIKAKKAKEKAEKAKEKAEKAREKAEKAAKKADDVKRNN